MVQRVRPAVVAVVVVFLGMGVVGSGHPSADDWIEVVSPNFRVVSDANEGDARRVAWQFEQIRTAILAGWPWAQAELDRPFLVIGVRNESSMRAFAPFYWEERGRVRPGSVSARGADRNFLLLRTDVRTDGREGVNPYRLAYWSYAQILLSDSFDGRLPFWLGRGLAAVLSNTNVTDDEVQFGRPVPDFLQEFRRGRYTLPELFDVMRDSPAFADEVGRRRFDAQCWGLLHFLVFGETGGESNAVRLNELTRLTFGGMPSAEAVTRVFGSVDALDNAYRQYLERGSFRYSVVKVDAGFDRKAFPSRALTPAEAAAMRASYLVTTARVVEARSAIDEAVGLDASTAEAAFAEGRLFERENNTDGARAAYARAVDLESDNFYAYVRLAALTPRQGATPETLATIEGLLRRSLELNPHYPAAYGQLGVVQLQQGETESAIVTLRRAIEADPAQMGHRMNLASALLRAGRRDEAVDAARSALAVARTDQQRAAAQSFIDRIGG